MSRSSLSGHVAHGSLRPQYPRPLRVGPPSMAPLRAASDLPPSDRKTQPNIPVPRCWQVNSRKRKQLNIFKPSRDSRNSHRCCLTMFEFPTSIGIILVLRYSDIRELCLYGFIYVLGWLAIWLSIGRVIVLLCFCTGLCNKENVL